MSGERTSLIFAVMAIAAAALCLLWLQLFPAAPPSAAQVPAELERRLKLGDSVATACAVLQDLEAETNCMLHEGVYMIAMVGRPQRGWRVVSQSVSVELSFEADGGLARIDCRDVLTGP